jgi:hypothetical protein
MKTRRSNNQTTGRVLAARPTTHYSEKTRNMVPAGKPFLVAKVNEKKGGEHGKVNDTND